MTGKHLTPHQRLLRSISEADWQSTVIDLATILKWNWWHDNDSRRNKGGLPDLLLWRPGDFIAVELKRETGIVSDKQARILAEWEAAGVETYVWRPSDRAEVEWRLRAASWDR
jgi:hypothetical protein